MRRFENWTERQWPRLLLHAGWAVFAIACLNSARLPAEALLIGPAMMGAAVAMIEQNKRENISRAPIELPPAAKKL